MFSEYMDVEKPLKEEEMVKNTEQIETGNNSIEDKSEQKIESLKSDISSNMTEYKGFFDSYPNSFHENVPGLSVREGLYESFASAIGGVTEKKIKGFDKTFLDGKKVEVREDGGQIYLKITQEGKDGKNKELSISLNNFESITGDKKDGEKAIQPTINVNGDESLLNDLLGNNNWEKKDFEQGLTMEKNPDLFENVFDSIHEKIIVREIQDLHGYVEHAKNIIDSENFPEFLLQQDDWRNPERGLDSNSFVEYLITCIEKRKIGEKTLETQDLMACRVLLSLCILLRNSSNNIQTIKESLGYDEEENIGKEKTIQGGENLIEFLPINETDLKKFMVCRDEVIKLAVQELTKEKEKLLSTENILNQNYTKKGGEITRLLNCLNK